MNDPSRCCARKGIALINSIIARNDAVSASVRDTYQILSSDPTYCVSVFAHRNEYDDVPCQDVRDTAQLLLEIRYREADLIIWHVATFYELFNAAMIGNGRARQVVIYHNTTPKEFMRETAWVDIDHALRQRHHLRYVDEVWNVSAVNEQVARSVGVSEHRNRVIPIIVDTPRSSALSEKARSPMEILFVGRFVKSKGVLELVEAVARLPRYRVPFHLTLVGNLEFSDLLYVGELRERIAAPDLAEQVTWLGAVDNPTLAELYRRSHILAIPSYHEGFCKPVIEGLRAGCIPIGYASYNLPYVANKLGRMVPTGNVAALKGAIDEILESLGPALASPDEARLPLDGGWFSIAKFDHAAHDYVQRFERAQVGRAILTRVSAILDAKDEGLSRLPHLPQISDLSRREPRPHPGT